MIRMEEEVKGAPVEEFLRNSPGKCLENIG
jgi:hypothetical protein